METLIALFLSLLLSTGGDVTFAATTEPGPTGHGFYGYTECWEDGHCVVTLGPEVSLERAFEPVNRHLAGIVYADFGAYAALQIVTHELLHVYDWQDNAAYDGSPLGGAPAGHPDPAHWYVEQVLHP